jgi:putative sterol carrier protein
VITGAPFGEGEVRFHMDTTDGTMRMEPGELDDAEVTVTTDYATARALLVDQDQAAGMQAFMSGKIRVQGDMTKLMMMQGAPVDDVAKSVAAEIKAITE